LLLANCSTREKEKKSSLTPRTGVTDIEMVAILLRGELGAGLAGNPVAEGGRPTLKLASTALGPIGDALTESSVHYHY
jgi:hypothetical protein